MKISKNTLVFIFLNIFFNFTNNLLHHYIKDFIWNIDNLFVAIFNIRGSLFKSKFLIFGELFDFWIIELFIRFFFSEESQLTAAFFFKI